LTGRVILSPEVAYDIDYRPRAIKFATACCSEINRIFSNKENLFSADFEISLEFVEAWSESRSLAGHYPDIEPLLMIISALCGRNVIATANGIESDATLYWNVSAQDAPQTVIRMLDEEIVRQNYSGEAANLIALDLLTAQIHLGADTSIVNDLSEEFILKNTFHRICARDEVLVTYRPVSSVVSNRPIDGAPVILCIIYTSSHA